MKVLTDEEHDNYIHPCGKTGKELKGFSECGDCEEFLECFESHAVLGFRDCNRIWLSLKSVEGRLD